MSGVASCAAEFATSSPFCPVVKADQAARPRATAHLVRSSSNRSRPPRTYRACWTETRSPDLGRFRRAANFGAGTFRELSHSGPMVEQLRQMRADPARGYPRAQLQRDGWATLD